MMKYLFTNNEKVGSKIISEFTKRSDLGQSRSGTPSHFAILFFGRFVFHSNFANGAHIQPYYKFKKENNILATYKKVRDKKTECEQWEMLDRYVKKAWGMKYDFPAIFYFSWRIFLHYFFKKPMPKVNKWERPGKWFCSEIYEIEFGQDVSMKTPNDLFWEMLSNPGFDQCETLQ